MYVWFNFPDTQFFFGASKISDFSTSSVCVLLIKKIEEGLETMFVFTSNNPTSSYFENLKKYGE